MNSLEHNGSETMALEWKERGNAYYGKQDFVQAADAYQRGLDSLKVERPENDEANSSLTVSLKTNLAMVLLKLKKFELAGKECSAVLERDPKNAKALYRRALAREGSALQREHSTPSHAEQRTLLIQAMDDLQLCMEMIEKSHHQDQKVKEACRTALDRVEKSYTNLEKPAQVSSPPESYNNNNNGNGPRADESTSPAPTPVPASVSQQKQDVVRLLMARQNAAADRPKGEAFFLLDWNWWCHWCRHVDFFYDRDPSSKPTDERIQRILSLFPPGAIVPGHNKKIRNRTDDDSDDDDSSTGSDPSQPPGPIHNGALLPENSLFYQQWYKDTPLRPNLVRGYHYELLPREVYNALRSWYGESTPSLCRRTTDDRVVRIYPNQTDGDTHPSDRPNKCCACRAPGALSRCKRCMAAQYCDRGCQEAHWPYHKAICKAASGKNYHKKNHHHLHGKHAGRIGLNNLGNTCFMNSAVQCLSHATPLIRYFLSNKFRADLNEDNPLGTGGKLALAFDTAMKEIWMRTKGTATSPTALKRAIALFAPRFAGCLQHDSQEFLAYLLDGLHEDLNRIRKAPYVEMPDVTDGHNMAIAGAEAWDAHRRRNDSLVLDSFYGQFQSTCICPKCNRVSVSFDAFNHVSLEIPQMHKITVTIPVLVFRAASGEMPQRYGVTLRRQSLIADLKRSLSELTQIAFNCLILCDVYENSIYELLYDKKPISSIRPNDVLAAYEVDPYSQTTIHVVATNALVMKDEEGKVQRPLFGFPFITSFDVNITCVQVWEHVWNIVSHMVVQKGAKKNYVDARGKYKRKDLLELRVVNSQGNHMEIFEASDGAPTSFIPIASKENIKDFLGEDCTENFLFLSLEWKNPEKSGGTEYKLIDPQLFGAYADHKSLIQAVQQQRQRNGQKSVSLDQCFETFTKPERLDENNMWYCSTCKEHVRALKTMKIWRLPNILIVHLKRFEFKHALRRDKLDTFVDYPLEGLDMNPHCSKWKLSSEGDKPFVNADIPAEYDLFAVVNHFGRMGFGHYTAFARRWDESGMSKEWCLFDDSTVRPLVNGESVATPAAYVLFYRRRKFN